VYTFFDRKIEIEMTNKITAMIEAIINPIVERITAYSPTPSVNISETAIF
jgi:hypothetical protein